MEILCEIFLFQLEKRAGGGPSSVRDEQQKDNGKRSLLRRDDGRKIMGGDPSLRSG